jgi:hypothetical protein
MSRSCFAAAITSSVGSDHRVGRGLRGRDVCDGRSGHAEQ